MKIYFLISLLLIGVLSGPVEKPDKRVSISTATSFSTFITTLPGMVTPGFNSLALPIFQTTDYSSSTTFWNNWNNFLQNINLGFTQGGIINGALSLWGATGGSFIFNAFNNIINVLTQNIQAVAKLDSGVGAQYNAQFLKLKDYIVQTNNTIAKAITAWPYAIISTTLGDDAYSNLSYILQKSTQMVNDMTLYWSNTSASNVYVPYCFDYKLNPVTGVVMIQMKNSFDLYYDWANTSQLYLGDKNQTLQGIQWSLDYQFSYRFNNMLSIFVHIVKSCAPVSTTPPATAAVTTTPTTTTTSTTTTSTTTPTTTTTTTTPTTTSTTTTTTTPAGPTTPTTTSNVTTTAGPTTTTPTTTTTTTTSTTTSTTTTTTPTTTTTTTPTTTTTQPTTTTTTSNCRLCKSTDYQCQMTGCKFTNNGKLIACIPWCQSDWTGPNQPKRTGLIRSLWGLEIYPYNCTWSIYLATNALDMLKVEVANNWTMIIGGYQSYVKLDNNQFFTALLNAFNFARNVFVNVYANSCIKTGPCVNLTIQKHLDLSMEAQMGYVSCLSFALNSLDQYNKWIYQAIDYEYNQLKIQVANCTNANGTINDQCLKMTIDPTFSDLWASIRQIMSKLSITSDVGYNLGQCISYTNTYVFNKLSTIQIDFNNCAGQSLFPV